MYVLIYQILIIWSRYGCEVHPSRTERSQLVHTNEGSHRLPKRPLPTILFKHMYSIVSYEHETSQSCSNKNPSSITVLQNPANPIIPSSILFPEQLLIALGDSRPFAPATGADQLRRNGALTKWPKLLRNHGILVWMASWRHRD